jgi:hypothetical protein
MEPAYFSAFAALAGSVIGGLTTLIASWVTQRVQFTTQQRSHDINKQEELFNAYIDEASKLYMDAFEHSERDGSHLVRLFALVSRMRLLCSPRVVETADAVARLIRRNLSWTEQNVS